MSLLKRASARLKIINTLYLAAVASALALAEGVAAADSNGIKIGNGQDNSDQMQNVASVLTTMQNIGFHWVAPALGGGLAIMGLFQIATRRIGLGLMALGGGGALFAVEKIAKSLANIGGGN